MSDQPDKDAADATARRKLLKRLRLNYTDMLPGQEVMEKACTFFLTATYKKTSEIIALLKNKDKTYEEEAEIGAAIRAAYAEAEAEAEAQRKA